jgi:hypothetical protein
VASGRKRKAGRPPVDDAERREHRVVIKLNAAQLDELERAAKSLGLPVSVLARARVTGERVTVIDPNVLAPKSRKET